MVPFVGLTGGIGAGKSTALDALARLGAATLSTDAVVHELYRTSELREAIAERFGEEVISGGEVDRSALAERAFATEADRRWLEEQLWPRVGERIVRWRAEAEAASPPPRAVVVEVPLLFESGMEHGFDATLAVLADEGVRAERAGARGHRALAERSTRQLSQREKAHRATYTVLNDGSVEELEDKLSEFLDMLAR